MNREKVIDDKLNRAFELFESNQLIEAEELYQECLKRIDTSSTKYKAALHWMGYVKSELKKFDEARSTDLIALGCSLRGLGEIYKATGEFEKAKRKFEQSIQAFTDGDDHVGVNEVNRMLDEF
ncbi:tetratricopeptide repeat protein [Sporosarcina koreensis]|uniref:tetratricopeptide repeat protein n=1 Tax=Sporosarcina koreensis TaxID=334735 RepID=UPI0007582B52|nr:tetratricopeptide repeat protein [Sporosarcina koreensis]